MWGRALFLGRRVRGEVPVSLRDTIFVKEVRGLIPWVETHGYHTLSLRDKMPLHAIPCFVEGRSRREYLSLRDKIPVPWAGGTEGAAGNVRDG